MARLTRWVASGFFAVVAAGCAYLAWLMLHGSSSAHSDTAPGVFVAMGVGGALAQVG